MQFNINDTVKVKLTDHGRDVYFHSHDRIAGVFPAANIPPPPPKSEDKDGYSEWQLWHLMQVFGPAIHLVGPLPFDPTIILGKVE